MVLQVSVSQKFDVNCVLYLIDKMAGDVSVKSSEWSSTNFVGELEGASLLLSEEFRTTCGPTSLNKSPNEVVTSLTRSRSCAWSFST